MVYLNTYTAFTSTSQALRQFCRRITEEIAKLGKNQAVILEWVQVLKLLDCCIVGQIYSMSSSKKWFSVKAHYKINLCAIGCSFFVKTHYESNFFQCQLLLIIFIANGKLQIFITISCQKPAQVHTSCVVIPCVDVWSGMFWWPMCVWCRVSQYVMWPTWLVIQTCVCTLVNHQGFAGLCMVVAL